MPLLFGRGSLISSVPGQQYSPRRDGVTIRATAIAAAGDGVQFDATSFNVGRAKAAGPPYQGPDPANPASQINLPGVTPFAVTRDLWENGPWQADGQSPTQGHATLQVAANGTLLAVGSGSGVPPLGQVMLPVLTEIGQQVAAAGNIAPLSNAAANSTLYLYVPVYDGTIGNGNTIIGFGLVQWTWDASSAAMTLTKGAAGTRPVGYGNLSGVLILGLPRDAAGNVTVDPTALFAAHAALSSPLYSPVLVNRYIGPTH